MRKKVFKQIDLNEGFAEGHLTKDVAESMGLDDLFKWGTLKKNLKVSDKKKRALNKISRFTNKVAGEWVLPPRKGKETTLLKAKIILKTALQKAFKNKKDRKEVEVELNPGPVMEESPQKLKKSGFGNLRPLLRDKLQKNR